LETSLYTPSDVRTDGVKVALVHALETRDRRDPALREAVTDYVRTGFPTDVPPERRLLELILLTRHHAIPHTPAHECATLAAGRAGILGRGPTALTPR
jgi:hypothetical protein